MKQRLHKALRRLGAVSAMALVGTAAFAVVVLADAPAASAKAPEVERVAPAAGSTAGGAEVTITGKVLAPNGPCTFTLIAPTCPELIVYFGNEPGFIFEGTKSKILAFAPTHAAGTVDVTVVSPMGTSAVNKHDKFTYSGTEPVLETNETPPVVKEVVPNRGSRAGFNQVIIRGEHLLPGEAGVCIQCAGDLVHFGSRNVAVAAGNTSELLVFAPPQAAGTVDVTVTTNPGGTSGISSADRYTYE